MFDLKGPKLNILICNKISFVGVQVAHMTRGGRTCSSSWVLYRSPPCTIVDVRGRALGKPTKKWRVVKTWRKKKLTKKRRKKIKHSSKVLDSTWTFMTRTKISDNQVKQKYRNAAALNISARSWMLLTWHAAADVIRGRCIAHEELVSRARLSESLPIGGTLRIPLRHSASLSSISVDSERKLESPSLRTEHLRLRQRSPRAMRAALSPQHPRPIRPCCYEGVWLSPLLIHGDMTYPCVPRLIYTCHDSCMCAMTHSCVKWIMQ